MKDIRRSFEIYKSSIDNIDKLDFYDYKEKTYITINFADYYKNLKLTCEKYKNYPKETQDKALHPKRIERLMRDYNFDFNLNKK
jgi:hypothetical protein